MQQFLFLCHHNPDVYPIDHKRNEHRQKTLCKKPLTITLTDPCHQKPDHIDHTVTDTQVSHADANQRTEFLFSLSIVIFKCSHISISLMTVQSPSPFKTIDIYVIVPYFHSFAMHDLSLYAIERNFVNL